MKSVFVIIMLFQMSLRDFSEVLVVQRLSAASIERGRSGGVQGGCEMRTESRNRVRLGWWIHKAISNLVGEPNVWPTELMN